MEVFQQLQSPGGTQDILDSLEHIACLKLDDMTVAMCVVYHTVT